MSDTPYSVAAAVLAHVQAQLDVCQRPVQSALVAVGGIVVDDCCAGLLAVAVERVFRAEAPFPTERGADGPCDEPLIGLDINVYLARCVPVLDDRGTPPTVAAQEAASAGVLADAAIVWQVAVGDALLGDDGYGDALWERANVTQLFTAADGGCVGVETRFTLGVPQYSWCLTCPPEVVPITPPGEGELPGEGGIRIVTGSAVGTGGPLAGAT